MTPELSVHYSILLAGGHSSRMGEDKAQLQFMGESFFQRGLNLLQAIGSELILVSGRAGQADTIPVSDIIPDSGPPGGLYSCLNYLSEIEKLDNSPLLIIPLDMPFLDEGVLLALLNHMSEQDACHFEGEVLPCALRASESLYHHLRELFNENHRPGGKRSMRAILSFCNSKVLQKSLLSEKVFKNINTYEEYEDCLSISQKKSG